MLFVFASKSKPRNKDFLTLPAWNRSLFLIDQLPRHIVLNLEVTIMVAQNVLAQKWRICQKPLQVNFGSCSGYFCPTVQKNLCGLWKINSSNFEWAYSDSDNSSSVCGEMDCKIILRLWGCIVCPKVHSVVALLLSGP